MSNTCPRSVMQVGKQHRASEQPQTRARRRRTLPPSRQPLNYQTCAPRGRRGRSRRRPPCRRQAGPRPGYPQSTAEDHRPAPAAGFTSGDPAAPRPGFPLPPACEGLPRPAALPRRARGGGRQVGAEPRLQSHRRQPAEERGQRQPLPPIPPHAAGAPGPSREPR